MTNQEILDAHKRASEVMDGFRVANNRTARDVIALCKEIESRHRQQLNSRKGSNDVPPIFKDIFGI